MILPDASTCYRAVQARDPRFDGWFFTAVRTTGIYCRPSCPAVTPKRGNVEFHPSAAAAQRAGFRACKRCRPDASPGSPEWDVRGDLAGRALRLIGDGVVDRDGVPGLARRLGYSERQVNRTLLAEVGAGPIALARAQRAQTARVLLETTELPTADVAFAAGFASVRQFNETMQTVFATTPTGLRAKRDRRSAGTAGEAGTIVLRLAYRVPMDLGATLDFLGLRAIPGVESVRRRGLHPRAARAGRTGAGVVLGRRGCRHLPGAADRPARPGRGGGPAAAAARPRRRPGRRRRRTRRRRGARAVGGKRPGLRSPGAVDGFEMAVRAIVGQQISVAGARTVLGRIAAAHGTVAFEGEPWRLFPDAGAVRRDRPGRRCRCRGPGLRPCRRWPVRSLPARLILDPGADRDRERAALLALPGIGPWTADYVQMRALADPDVLLGTDLGVRKSAAALDVRLSDGRPDVGAVAVLRHPPPVGGAAVKTFWDRRRSPCCTAPSTRRWALCSWPATTSA